MAQGAPTTEPASSSRLIARHGYDNGIGGKEAYGLEADGGPRHIPQTWRKHRFERNDIPSVRYTGSQYQWHSFLIRDIEDRKPDKVGVFGNSIPLSSHGRERLGELLMMRVKHLNSKEDPIYPFTATDYRKVFQKRGERLGLKNLHPYQTRHGGASEDLNSAERDHQGVKIRGRWHTDQSVRRYGKVGGIQRSMANLSPAHMGYGIVSGL